MAAPPIFVSRLVRLPLLNPQGAPLGQLDDVVVSPSGMKEPPRVLGFATRVGRSSVFVNANRVEELDSDGARLHGPLDPRRFEKRPGEILVRREILDRRIGGEVVHDVAIRATPGEVRAWEVTEVMLSSAGLLRRRRAARRVPWSEVPALFDAGGPVARQVAALRELHPSEMAARVVRMPLERRRQLAEAMEDERLADLLEELPEDEQVRLIESLDLERAADVLEAMEADDAADLLAELPAAEREELLDAMEPDEASPLRRLLRYEPSTAGGLMNPEPVVVSPSTPVAEALARMRRADIPMALAAHVFVAYPPLETPTGRYIGPISFQRLLREAPSTPVSQCIDDGPDSVPPEMSESEVARRAAAYDAVAIPVVDSAGRLLGAVTVDDVLDHVLPEGWRR